MGLGLRLYSELPRGFLGRRKSGTRALTELAKSLHLAVEDTGLRRFIAVETMQDRVSAQLHPCEENVQFSLTDDQRLVCSAKSSSCGPGYHAHLVDVLDRLGDQLGITWNSDDSEFVDDTAYWRHRSFERLQTSMVKFLKILFRRILESAYTQTQISMPIDVLLPEPRVAFALTQLGPRSRERLEQMANSESAEDIGRSFFPWWNQEANGHFWRQTGLALCWTVLRWNVPEKEARRSYELALYSFEQSRRIDPTVTMPETEINEIRQLLAGEEISHPESTDAQARIGYWRLSMRRPFPGPWNILLPGYFHEGEEDEGIVVYWFANRTVRGSSLQVKSGPVVPREVFRVRPSNESKEIINCLADEPPGWAEIAFQSDQDGDYWMLTGQTGAQCGLCITTVCFTAENDRQWAIDTWRSVRCTADLKDGD